MKCKFRLWIISCTTSLKCKPLVDPLKCVLYTTPSLSKNLTSNYETKSKVFGSYLFSTSCKSQGNKLILVATYHEINDFQVPYEFLTFLVTITGKHLKNATGYLNLVTEYHIHIILFSETELRLKITFKSFFLYKILCTFLIITM